MELREATVEADKHAVDGIRIAVSRIKDVVRFIQSDAEETVLVSYPKSGVTWLRFMLAEYFARAYDIPRKTPTVNVEDLPNICGSVPRVRATHDGSEILREDGSRPNARDLFVYGKRLRYRRNNVILLSRDPRDVVVSYYHQVTRRSERPMTFDSIGEFVRHPVLGIRRIIRFYDVWAQNMDVPRHFKLVRYEDLLADGVTTLTELIRSTGCERIDGDVVGAVYEYAKPDSMRELERADRVEGMRKFGNDPNAMKVRRARSGTYLDELSDGDIHYCDEQLATLPSIFGYSGETDRT